MSSTIPTSVLHPDLHPFVDIYIRDCQSCKKTTTAVERGHVNCLARIWPQNRFLSACELAAAHGHLDILVWLRSQDPPCPWDESTCILAACSGHLDILVWLRSQKPPCPWGQHTCFFAALAGHLEVLIWLRSQDPPCPWDPQHILSGSTTSAVRNYVLTQ